MMAIIGIGFGTMHTTAPNQRPFIEPKCNRYTGHAQCQPNDIAYDDLRLYTRLFYSNYISDFEHAGNISNQLNDYTKTAHRYYDSEPMRKQHGQPGRCGENNEPCQTKHNTAGREPEEHLYECTIDNRSAMQDDLLHANHSHHDSASTSPGLRCKLKYECEKQYSEQHTGQAHTIQTIKLTRHLDIATSSLDSSAITTHRK